MKCCPTCKQELPESKLIVDLNSNHIVLGTMKAKLTPREAEILKVLHDAAPKFVSDQYIEACVVGIDEDSRSVDWATQYISRLRKILRPFRISIINRHKVGYQLQVNA